MKRANLILAIVGMALLTPAFAQYNAPPPQYDQQAPPYTINRVLNRVLNWAPSNRSKTPPCSLPSNSIMWSRL